MKLNCDVLLSTSALKLNLRRYIKKAYRQMALKHHPDKSCNGLPGWADSEALRSDANGLFKLVGEAHASLSDEVGRCRLTLSIPS